MGSVDHLHWDYYISLTEELKEISRFVEFTQSNFKTHSIAFTRLLLSAGSEVDVVAKQLCKRYAPTTKFRNINECRDTLLRHLPALPTIETTMHRHKLNFIPWKEWESGKNPEWWTAYNKVKHQRNANYGLANLEMCLEATAGLCVLVGYLYPAVIEDGFNAWRLELFLAKQYRRGGNLLVSTKWVLP